MRRKRGGNGAADDGGGPAAKPDGTTIATGPVASRPKASINLIGAESTSGAWATDTTSRRRLDLLPPSAPQVAPRARDVAPSTGRHNWRPGAQGTPSDLLPDEESRLDRQRSPREPGRDAALLLPPSASLVAPRARDTAP